MVKRFGVECPAPAVLGVSRLGRLFFARQRTTDFFHPRGKPMPVLLASHHRLTRHPVELNHAARAGERPMPMP